MAGAGAAPGDRESDLKSQHAAIQTVCRRRGWDLVRIYEDASVDAAPDAQVHRAEALTAIQDGAADVLVAARHDRLCESRAHLAPMVERSRREGWRLLVIDLWIDTMTPSGRRMADFIIEATQEEVPRTDLPLPPPELRYRVSGVEAAEGFELSGHLHARAFGDALEAVGRTYDEFSSIYDFGCGCGRIMRHLPRRAPSAQLHGSDIDEPAIAWLREHMPQADTRVNDWLPPLSHPGETFDLVIGFSVFTHLDEEYQDAWLGELWRVTHPGAVLLLTVNGPVSWRWHSEGPFDGMADLGQMEAALQRDGFLHWRDDGWEKHFPDYYHTTFHLPGYVRSRWGQHFEVLRILEGAAVPTQDIVVLRRR